MWLLARAGDTSWHVCRAGMQRECHPAPRCELWSCVDSYGALWTVMEHRVQQSARAMGGTWPHRRTGKHVLVLYPPSWPAWSGADLCPLPYYHDIIKPVGLRDTPEKKQVRTLRLARSNLDTNLLEGATE